MSDVRARLRDVPVPGEHEARERALSVVRAAYRDHEPVPPRRAPRAPLLAALIALAAVAGLALTPPGQAVTRWVRERVGLETVHVVAPRPALERLPAAGSLLVGSPRGTWVVHRDGSKRRLGAYRDATWSPHGLFVAAVHGNDLVALTPAGQVRWTLTRAAPRTPDWSPSGFRIAYVSGGWVRVVAGDGTGDRRLARGSAPSWAPGAAHVLAYSPRGGGLRVVNTDTRRELWHAGHERATRISWSAEGTRVATAAPDGIRIRTGGGGRPRRHLLGSAAEYAPRGRDLALARGGELTVGGRLLFQVAGRLRGVAWSPDGRWLVVDWPGGRQWLFVRVSGTPAVVTVPAVAAGFDPGSASPRGQPAPAGWCCAR